MNAMSRPPPPPGNRVVRITGRGAASRGASGPDADPLAGLPGIDAAAARAALMGNEKLYRRLLGMFVDQHAEVQTRLAAAMADDDVAAVTREAHDLGGLAASLGMSALTPHCRRLEQACRAGVALSEAGPLVEPLRLELQRLVQQLSALRPLLG